MLESIYFSIRSYFLRTIDSVTTASGDFPIATLLGDYILASVPLPPTVGGFAVSLIISLLGISVFTSFIVYRIRNKRTTQI